MHWPTAADSKPEERLLCGQHQPNCCTLSQLLSSSVSAASTVEGFCCCVDCVLACEDPKNRDRNCTQTNNVINKQIWTSWKHTLLIDKANKASCNKTENMNIHKQESIHQRHHYFALFMCAVVHCILIGKSSAQMTFKKSLKLSRWAFNFNETLVYCLLTILPWNMTKSCKLH